MTNLVKSTHIEIPDREKGGKERKNNYIYKLFHCTVGPMSKPFHSPHWLCNQNATRLKMCKYSLLRSRTI